MSTRLSGSVLPTLADRLEVPAYDRSALATGIVHIGVGNFHRAHQAVYLDRLLAEGKASEWAICGVGLRPGDARMRDVLDAQDGLYTLLTKHPDGTTEGHVIGAITDYVLATDDPEAAVARLADPATRIVSLTITEGGYNVVEATGDFDFDNPDVRHELAHGEPRTVYGFLTAALRRRRDAGVRPFTVMSCDNVQHNGDLARRMMLAFAGCLDADLAAWIEREVTFPNTMVDRITPVTDEADVRYVEETYGVRDAWPVPCEPFIQWIVEDRFSDGRPDLEAVGVTFVDDVTPYEEMKLRLLNAGHSVVGLLGAVHGYGTIDACMADPVFAGFLAGFLREEAAPPLGTVEGVDLDAYQESLVRRFGNPAIRDTVARICSYSSDKLPKFLLPTIRANLASGGPIDRATLVVAAWCFYSDRQASEAGEPLDIRDPMRDELHRAARGTADDALSFIRLEPVFGDLSQSDRFAERYAALVRQLYAETDVHACMAPLA